MRLIRGRRYGLCGPNGVGKSTLMRAIANGQVDGFPPADELRTVYVEHDIQVRLSLLGLSPMHFITASRARCCMQVQMPVWLECINFLLFCVAGFSGRPQRCGLCVC